MSTYSGSEGGWSDVPLLKPVFRLNTPASGSMASARQGIFSAKKRIFPPKECRPCRNIRTGRTPGLCRELDRSRSGFQDNQRARDGIPGDPVSHFSTIACPSRSSAPLCLRLLLRLFVDVRACGWGTSGLPRHWDRKGADDEERLQVNEELPVDHQHPSFVRKPSQTFTREGRASANLPTGCGLPEVPGSRSPGS